jgi:hypothetical protein
MPNIHQYVTSCEISVDAGTKETYETKTRINGNWDILLDTRGYWTINQYTFKIPYLSMIDLLKMRKGLYFPYFLNDDKSLRDEYKNRDKEDEG